MRDEIKKIVVVTVRRLGTGVYEFIYTHFESPHIFSCLFRQNI